MVKVNEKDRDKESKIREILDSHGFRMSPLQTALFKDDHYKITARKRRLNFPGVTVYGKIKRMDEDPIIVEIDEDYEAVLESLKSALMVIEDELEVECVLRVE